MKYTLLLVLACFVAFVSCEEKGYTKPEGIPSHDKMVDILYEIHLSQATSQHIDSKNLNYRQLNDAQKKVSDSLYAYILNKHQLTDSLLGASIVYYSSQLKTYDSIYSDVIDKLKMKQKELEELDLIARGMELEQALPDSAINEMEHENYRESLR